MEPASELTANRDVALTRRGNILYVHLLRAPETSSVFLAPMAIAPRRATLLNTGEPVGFDVELLPRFLKPNPRTLRLKDLPVNTHQTAGWVVKLEFEDGRLTG